MTQQWGKMMRQYPIHEESTPMTDPRYHYRCRLIHALDGDTVLLEVELGFHLTYEVTTRLAGINAPERRSGSQAEREAGEKTGAGAAS
jgi:endonuclease YncB( thermonuclease family)